MTIFMPTTMMMLTPRLLVAMAVLWVVTVTVQSRPTVDSGEPELEESAEPPPDPTVLMVPVRVLTDPDSSFGKILRNQLRTMSDHDLSVLESSLQTGTKTDRSEDDDVMMGDMPSADDPQDSSSPATSLGLATVTPDDYTDEMLRRESDKNLRIQTIHNQMINFMGRNIPQILSPSPMMKPGPIPIQQRDAIRIFYDNLNNFPTYPSDAFTEKTQSFYPTCDLPRHTNEEVWNTKESMNLMFNISLPKSSKGISINVNMARLRLYKQFVSCYSQSSNETDDSQACPSTFYVETMKQPNTNLSTAGVVPLIMDERQIRVSIYAYTRSLKRKRVKRKLLDSRMVPYYSEKWTEWNIRNAVKAWHKNPVRNYGINVEVEDEDGNLLPVSKFFRPMNCSGDAQMMTPKPVPGFIMEAVHNGYGNPTITANNTNANTVDAFALSFNMHRYPIMDITTVEVPESEVNNAMLYQYAKNTFEQVGGSDTVSAPYLPAGQGDQGNQHRIRHGSRQHQNNGTIPGSLSRDGHELRDQIIVQGVIQRNVQHKPQTTEIPDFG
ncbi:uncharacterized protein LOC112597873 isoform X2 [Melanaphis sacchari]|uniref:uncharacterized protein LOC112597873 isoform X2 n=1 Tax=Melanaphis sacchari TaxID=742174 RepID=UPI000DC12D17|nr:uncharacterized protein LOC112597873 isoform X2 [Melanaphis sacchari]